MSEGQTKRRFKKRYIPLVLLVIYLGWRFWPAPDVVLEISKETTWITEPLDVEGRPDYVAAYNQMLSKGVTEENNAGVLLLPLIDDIYKDQIVRERIYLILGLEQPGEEVKRFVDFSVYIKGKLKQREAEELARKVNGELQEKSWKAEDYPLVAEWLENQRDVIKTYIEASKREKYYIPRIASEEGNSLLHVALPDMGGVEDLSEFVSIQIMRLLGEGKVGAALDLIESQIRIGLLVTQRKGNALDLLAGSEELSRGLANLQYLVQQHPIENIEKVRQLAKLVDLPDPGQAIYISVNDYERIVCLSVASEVIYDDNFVVGGDIEELAPYVDMNIALQTINAFYNIQVEPLKKLNARSYKEVLNLTARAQNQILSTVEGSLESFKLKSTLCVIFLNRSSIRDILSNDYAFMMVQILLGNYQSVYERVYETYTRGQLLRLALGCEGYYLTHGKYPAQLEELKGKWVEEVPIDPFSGKPFVYEATDHECLIYSFGKNVIDDGGVASADGKSNKGDLVIELKRGGGQ